MYNRVFFISAILEDDKSNQRGYVF